MLVRLFLLLVIVLVIEVSLLIKIGSLIGGLATAALLLTVSCLGAYLVRSQGFRIVADIQRELAQGRLPAGQMLDGALVLVGGVLLMTPGFFTDFLGIFFLIPAIRRLIKLWLGLWLQARLARGAFLVRRR
jgi:UPF0716 protein FxsA